MAPTRGPFRHPKVTKYVQKLLYTWAVLIALARYTPLKEVNQAYKLGLLDNGPRYT